MKIVKITPAEYRVWRANVTQVVGEDGVPLRDVTLEEVAILKDLDKRATATKKVELAYVGDGETETKIEVVPRVVANGIVALARTIDGNRIMTGRQVMLDALLKKHGSFQLRTFNGRFPIASVREGGSTASAASTTPGVPGPDSCTCKDYFRRVKGKHHSACQYNSTVMADQRGSKDEEAATAAGIVTTAPAAAPVVAPRVRFVSGAAGPVTPGAAVVTHPIPGFMSPKDVKVIEAAEALEPAVAAIVLPMSPETCPNGCTKWANYSNDGKHHPVCQWRQPWEDSKGGVEPRFLVDLETEAILREATPEEIAEADGNLGIAKIADKSYGVLPKSEISTASAAE
jgi:hypothetical protein